MINTVKSRISRTLSTAKVVNSKVLTAATILVVVLITVIAGVTLKGHPHADSTVPGESYQTCNEQGQYLTSPWTYNALASGSQSYTVAQYEALPGYGTTLPPLPAYISGEPSSTHAATIYAPTASGVQLAGYQIDGTPTLFFFEGGNYGAVAVPSVSGNLYIGGSASGFPEPVFNDGGNADGIGNSTSHYGFDGGHDTGSGSGGSKTLTVSSGGEQANSWLTFTDGTNYKVASASGTTVTLTSALSTSESGATFWYNNNNAGNGGLNQMAEVSSSAAQGSTTLSVGGWSGSQISQPIVPGENIVVGDSTNGSYLVDAVSGTQSGGYSLTLDTPLAAAAGAGAPVWYQDQAGGVTVQYLNIGNDDHSTDGTITAGSYWTIENNDIHDGYAGGANFQNTSSSGIAIASANRSTINYNCFQRMGEYALNGGGNSTKFDYNQVDETPYQPDLSGNGQSGCGKWWASTNNDVVDNAFTDEGYSVCIWFDNGNTGMLVQGNYFYNIGARAIQNETGWNSEYDDNLFQDVDSAIYQNDSGGWNIPGSRYNNQIIIQNNIFNNVKEAVNIWGASGRSCLNSGESISNGESSPYCSGGFPQMPSGQQYFSHNYDTATGAFTSVAQNQTCSVGAPCSTVKLADAPTTNEWIGFNGLAPNAGATDPVSTTSNDTTNVSTFTGSGTLHVPSTTGFPSSGQLLADTSAGGLYGATGSVLSYTGTTATTFTGVTHVSGSGTLTSGGKVVAVQPYHVTAVNCAGGNCTNNAVVSLSPALTSNVSAGTDVFTTGTCQYYDTVTATATSPTAPNGTPYIDGCMWENRNISVTGNTFFVNAAQFDSVTLPEGQTGNWSCTTGAGGDCGQNQMGYQYPGGNAEPYNNVAFSNAMMSSSSLPSPLNNLNASGSPLAGGSNGDVGVNSETPYNDVWSNNTYIGDWRFQAYVQAAACPVDWTGTALSWNGGTSGNACSGLSLAQWQSYWQQDAGSNESNTPPPATPNNVTAVANSATSVTVNWSASSDSGGPGLGGYDILRNGTQIGSVNASTTSYTDNGASANTQYSYTVEAYDTATPADVSAQSTAATVTTPASAQSPTVGITSVSNNALVHGNALALDSNDTPVSGNSISSVQLLVNNAAVQTITVAPYNFTLNTLNYSDGSYNLTVKATDNHGNIGSSTASVTITNGDLNSDNKVSLADLAVMASNWNKQSGATYAQGDLNSDGKINVQDLAILAANWGKQW